MTNSAEFDYVKFINEGFDAQQKYSTKARENGPLDYQLFDKEYKNYNDAPEFTRKVILSQRYAKIIEMMSHMIEEIVEARVYVPRRSWKKAERSYLDDEQLRREFIAEMYDVILFHRAVLAYAGVTGEEFAQIAAEKQAYNQVRPDHAVNNSGDASAAPPDPSAELQGNCNSANF